MEETMAGCQRLAFKDIHNFIMSLVGEDLHAKRVYSLANATQGIITSASLADWTDFDADKQATIMLSLITQHGRTTSLVWLTVDKDTLKHNRNRYEHTVLVRLAEALPSDVEVLIVADRGFGDHKLYQVLTDELKFDYLIRFRGNIKVTAAEGETRSATDWVGAGGRMRILRGCAVTADGYPVGAVVCVQAKDMKAPWCLCTSLKDVKAKSLLAKYAKRWGDRVFLPRYQGSALWSWHGREPHQLARTA